MPTQIYVPFKYDLGGSYGEVEPFERALAQVVGPVVVDSAAARSFNLSYLAAHPPILRTELQSKRVNVGTVEYTLDRHLRIYPWLGVLSIDHLFEPVDGRFSASQLLAFYDDLVELKNEDYLTYLDGHGEMSEGLRLRTGYGNPNKAPELPLGSLVNEIREALAKEVDTSRLGSSPGPGAETRRPGIYAFHDFRVFFMLGELSSPDQDFIDELALLSSDASGVSESERSSLERYEFSQGLHLCSSGWVTVAWQDPAVGSAGVQRIETATSLFSLCHAQWFLCQIWIYIYEQRSKADGTRAESLWEISNEQLLLSHDLTEVANLDVMLKDPQLIRIALFFVKSLGIHRHREAAEARLAVIRNHYQEAVDYRSSSDAQRLQLLFAFSAAAAVAALVPPLVGLDGPFVAATVVLAVILWAGFTLDIAIILKRLRRERRQST